jgi:hypothetical protein
VDDKIIDDYILQNHNFVIDFYFMNALINPSQTNYIDYYLEDRNYYPFSKKTSVTSNIFITQNDITTDNSISPFKNL